MAGFEKPAVIDTGTSLIYAPSGLGEELVYRFVFSVPLLLLFSIIARGKKAFKISQKKTMATRIIFGFLGMVKLFHLSNYHRRLYNLLQFDLA